MEHPRHRFPCLAGPQFGSRSPGDPRRLTLHDFLPDQQLLQVENLHDFAGMLVFDKWTYNTNGRQTLFLADSSSTAGTTVGVAACDPVTRSGASPAGGAGGVYRTLMIDQGFCFSAGDWKFPDAPLRGLYPRNRVYQGVTGMQSFGPCLERLNATTSLTFTITNPAANTAALTGVAFSDTLPLGLTVANASAAVCGGTLTTTAPTGIVMSGATIAINSLCQFSISVAGTVAGNFINTTGPVSSTNGGTGNSATANLIVALAPVVTKHLPPRVSR